MSKFRAQYGERVDPRCAAAAWMPGPSLKPPAVDTSYDGHVSACIFLFSD